MIEDLRISERSERCPSRPNDGPKFEDPVVALMKCPLTQGLSGVDEPHV